MDRYRVAHLPVVEKGKFLGMASETAMLSAGDVVSDPEMHYTNLIDGSVEPDEHILEVLKSASELHLTAIPVVDKTGNFLGCVTLEDLVEKLSQMQGADRPGGIIVLEMAEQDYSLQQIARIVEDCRG